MMLFELKAKAKKLPLLAKLWMYPMAYVLTAVSGVVVWAVDLFNAATFRRMANS